VFVCIQQSVIRGLDMTSVELIGLAMTSRTGRCWWV